MSATIDAYDAAVATLPGVERKGATMPYTSVNGNMFSFVDKEGAIAIRLGDGDRAAFVAAYGAKPSVQHGVVQKDYLIVPASVLREPANLAGWFAKSYAHASTLPPKATKRPAAKPAAAKPASVKKPAAAKKKPAAKR